MTIKGQKKAELIIYAVLWAILFAAAALSVYTDSLPDPKEMVPGVAPKPQPFDWSELTSTWKLLTMFCAAFFIHNFFAAPLLVYCKKKWQYGISTAVLMAVFFAVMTARVPHRPQPDYGPRAPLTDAMRRQRDTPPPMPSDKMPKAEGHAPKMDGNEPKAGEPIPMKARPFGGPTAVAFNIMLLLIALNVGTKYYFKSLDDHKLLKELERDNLNQQLQYLKYQINPHFFMNTLNNIHALVDIDPEEAKHTIEVLSKLMRYVLYDADKPMAPLQKELGFLRNYIDLMRIRYTDSVRITVSLPEKMPNAQVPSLLFATFVENAFKHGVSYQKESFVEVSATVDEEGGTLRFACDNSRKPEDESDTKGGVGLENAMRRLKLIYGNAYSLDIKADAETYRLLLKLPIKQESIRQKDNSTSQQ